MGSDRTSFLLMEFIYFLFFILNLKKNYRYYVYHYRYYLIIIYFYLFILFLTILMHF